MSVRAEKPLRLMLVPIVPPSAEPMVTPGTLRSAFSIVVAPCDCISARLMTTTVCGTSISSVAPRRLSDPRVTWKSSLGRPPVTVTGCIVTGDAVGSPGLACPGGGVGAGPWAFWSGACWATAAAGAMRIPKTAVWTCL